jgi:hypothetical protein
MILYKVIFLSNVIRGKVSADKTIAQTLRGNLTEFQVSSKRKCIIPFESCLTIFA